MNQLFQRFRRDITALVWLSIGIFLALSLWSYNPNDPSLNSIGTDLVSTNLCGYFGSFLSDLFYQLFGLGSWVFVLASFRFSFRSLKGSKIELASWRWLWAVLLLVTVCSLAALYFPEKAFFGSQVSAGGLIGALLSQGLVAVFNFIGVAIILWTSAIVLLVFYTEKTIQQLAHMPWDASKSSYFFVSDRLEQEHIERFKQLLNSLNPSKFIKTTIERVEVKATEEPVQEKTLFKQAKEMPEGFYSLDEDESEEDEELPEVAEATKISFFGSKKKVEASTSSKKRKVSMKKKVNRHVENWELPKLSLLEDPPEIRTKMDEKEIRRKADLLVNKLEQFNVRGKVVGISPGPAVTMFEFKPNVEVKLSNITKLADDLSLALSSESVRIIAPIPGRDVVGIETSNTTRETVYLKDILADEEFWDEEVKLPLALGRQADGESKVVDLRKMPHLLVAGSTGSGKSVFTVSSLTGLLFRHSPKTLRMVLVDPKQVDLAAFNEIPHLLIPPVREAKKAIGALKWSIKEMEKRYRSMSKFGARGLEDYNKKVEALTDQQRAEHQEYNENLEGAAKLEEYYYESLPYIVIVVEEFGDLMAVDKNNVEQAVVRLAQMARACGIHLVLAMQSPRKDVVTGLIKTNIPGRVSFKVASKMDSRIILDESGAERLLSRGDMLFLAPGVSKPGRHHGPWATDDDINEVCEFWRSQSEPDYDTLAMRAIEGSGGGFNAGPTGDFGGDDNEYDEKYDEILSWVSTVKEVSASLLQRRFRLGYPRAARMIEIFEEQGVVGPSRGSKPRQVLVNELK